MFDSYLSLFAVFAFEHFASTVFGKHITLNSGIDLALLLGYRLTENGGIPSCIFW
jgi:hypothetical protein